jgi:hypothetical protein
VPVKVRALGYRLAPLRNGPRITRFSHNELELLKRLEHLRWCAERWLSGWEYGPVRDRAARISPSLRAWTELPPDEQEKDEDQIRALPAALEKIGMAVVP